MCRISAKRESQKYPIQSQEIPADSSRWVSITAYDLDPPASLSKMLGFQTNGITTHTFAAPYGRKSFPVGIEIETDLYRFVSESLLQYHTLLTFSAGILGFEQASTEPAARQNGTAQTISRARDIRMKSSSAPANWHLHPRYLRQRGDANIPGFNLHRHRRSS